MQIIVELLNLAQHLRKHSFILQINVAVVAECQVRHLNCEYNKMLMMNLK